jgi:Xaa-Pro dipeptidase
VFVLQGTNTDTGAEVSAPALPEGTYALDTTALHTALVEARVFKTVGEQRMLREANAIGSEGLLATMAGTVPGWRESQAEALFGYYAKFVGGARYWPYGPIAASGPRCAVLHYGHSALPNDQVVADGDMCLYDMGCEAFGFGSDITVTFPANGKFTPEQAAIYNIVWASHQAVLAQIKPGCHWPSMHQLAYSIIGQGLLDLGVLKGNLADILEANIVSLFMPHGLGHLIGLETHDVGGYPATQPEVKRAERFGHRSVRCGRTLEANMTLTIEPGCYFNRTLIDVAMGDERAHFFDAAKVEQYTPVGGVRLEDNVLVTQTGNESFTYVPRTVEEVELACAGGIHSLQQLRDMRK